MIFNIVDFNDTITKITSTIDANCEKASVTRREIEKLKKQNVNNDEERKSFGVLNTSLVSLLSAIKSDSKGEDLNNIKKLLKEFATQSKTVGGIIENHMK